MYFLFSGEGLTDCGTGDLSKRISERSQFHLGPMTMLVDQIVKREQEYSPVASKDCGLLPKAALVQAAKGLRHAKKGVLLPGGKRARETAYFYRAAQALARKAKTKAHSCKDDVVAVLFRDCDGSHSAPRGLWRDIQKSILDGFAAESFGKGVPMVPKPTSEAWLLCALKSKPYENCRALEARSPSPKAKVPLKAELEKRLSGDSSREHLCALFDDNRIDACRIDMPSFNAFKERLLAVI